MALTYAQLTAAVLGYLEDDGTTFTGSIDTFIRQAESRILHIIEVPATWKNQTGTLTASNRYLTLPSDFQYPQGLFVTSGTTSSYLLIKDATFIREAYPTTTTTGLPRFYGVFDDTTIILGPTPDSNYAVQLEYFGFPDSIVDVSTSWLGNFAEELLLYGVLVEAYTFLKGETDLWQAYEKKFQDALGPFVEMGKTKVNTDSFRTPTLRRMTA